MRFFFAIFLLYLSLPSVAQESKPATQLSFSYMGNVINEQGARIGLQHYLKHEKDQAWKPYLYPSVSYVSRPLFYSNFTFGADVGVKRQKGQQKIYHAFNLGLNYLARMEIIAFTVDFKGEVVSKDREYWDYAMPMISYEFGKDMVENIGWFIKLDYGLRFPFQESQDRAGMPYFEAGMKLPLYRQKDESQ